MSDDEELIEGKLPDNAVLVSSFTVGYGSLAAFNEEGAQSLPMVAVGVNEGRGPMLMLGLDTAPKLIGELMEAVPKSLSLFDPQFAEKMEEEDKRLDRVRRALRFHRRSMLIGYLVAILVAVVAGLIASDLDYTGNLLLWLFAAIGLSYMMTLLIEEFAPLVVDRKKRRAAE
jgi:hypothetical protein